MVWLLPSLLLAAPLVILDHDVEGLGSRVAFQGSDAERASSELHLAAEAVAEGRAAAVELDWEQAIARFEHALSIYREWHFMLADQKDVITCLLDLGAAWMGSGSLDRADIAFRKALLFDPALEPNALLYTPDVVNRVRKLAKGAKRKAAGSLSVVTVPEHAVVWLDGKRVGQTPLSLQNVPAGEHWLSAILEGYERFTSVLLVAPGKVERADLFMMTQTLDPAAALLLAAKREAEPDTTPFSRLAAEKQVDALFFVWRDAGRLAGRAFDAGDVTLSATFIRDERSDLDIDFERFVSEPASAPASAPQLAPVVLRLPQEPPPRVHPVLALIPFGAAQFAEHRPLPGALLLATEVALLVTNIACVAVVLADRRPDGLYNNASRSDTLRWVGNAALFTLIAEMIGGAVDGLVHR